MTKKLIVNKETMQALDLVKTRMTNGKILENQYIAIYENFPWSEHGEYSVFNNLSLEQMAQALFVGYELEKSKEDKIRDIYQEASSNSRADIKNVLALLNIQIIGVNV